MNSMVSLLWKIPFLRPVVRWGIMRHRIRLVQDLLRRLYPVGSSADLVRFGPDGDGGYLIPNDLDGIDICFSPGVCETSGFELDCANRGMKVFLADASVERPAEEHELFSFTKHFIGGYNREGFITLNDWVNSSIGSGNYSDMMLQIDIEGFEYEVFPGVSQEIMEHFRIIVIEMHDLDLLLHPRSNKYTDIVNLFDKLLETHVNVHAHPNNCCGFSESSGIQIPKVMEFTFQRRDRLKTFEYRRDFPHQLDCDNTENESLELPKCWYAPAS